MARTDLPVLEIWHCRRPDCGAHNVAANAHCTVCLSPKPGGRPIPGERILPAIDFEAFCRRNFAAGAKRPRTEVHLIANEVYVTLTPDGQDGTTAAVYQVDQNDLHPCDSLGRRTW